jgi:hypothetical protein
VAAELKWKQFGRFLSISLETADEVFDCLTALQGSILSVFVQRRLPLRHFLHCFLAALFYQGVYVFTIALKPVRALGLTAKRTRRQPKRAASPSAPNPARIRLDGSGAWAGVKETSATPQVGLIAIVGDAAPGGGSITGAKTENELIPEPVNV